MSASPFKSACAGPALKQITFDKVPLPQATEYAAEDADITLAHVAAAEAARSPPESVARVYERVDRPLVAPIGRHGAAQGSRGRPRLSRRPVERVRAPRSPRSRSRVYEAACRSLHRSARPSNSATSCSTAWASRAGARANRGTGRPNQSELERLERDGVPIARKILEWRQVAKLKSTYTDACSNRSTGHPSVHTAIDLFGAQTGRFVVHDRTCRTSPSDETARGSARPSSPSRVMSCSRADYRQIELRLAARMADVPELKEASTPGADIHNLAEELFADRQPRNPRPRPDE